MATTYTLISSYTASGTVASVTLSSIPSTYTDLLVKVSARSGRVSVVDSVYMDFNITGNIFSNTFLQNSGGTVAYGRNNITSLLVCNLSATGNNATANAFGSLEVYFPNYTVSQNHPVGAHGNYEDNTNTGYIETMAGLIRNTGTINSITFTPYTGGWLTGSTFYIYGIKNS